MLPVQLLPQVGHRSCAHTDSAGKKKDGTKGQDSPCTFTSRLPVRKRSSFLYIFIIIHLLIVRFNNPDLNSVLTKLV